jgi:hypothetical protein
MASTASIVAASLPTQQNFALDWDVIPPIKKPCAVYWL